MTKDIMETGKMYVVWHYDAKVQSPQDGIEKVIESVRGTNAEYVRHAEDAARIVRDTAREYADEEYFSARGVPDQVTSKWKDFVKDYGVRAIYEIRVRQVGNVDANGRFTEIKPRTKRKRK